MPAEEGLIYVIGRAILWIFLEIFYQLICYKVGYIVIKIVTLGTHPKNPSEYEDMLSLLGMLILFVAMVTLLVS